MAEFSSSEMAQLVLDRHLVFIAEYLIRVKCYDAASIFQDTSPDLCEFRKQILQQETTASALPRSTLDLRLPKVTSLGLASILNKTILPKNEHGTMAGQLRRKRLTKDQKVILNNLFTLKSSVDDKINLASIFGITKAQFQSWHQKMQNIEKKKNTNRINLLEKKLNVMNSRLEELKQNKKSQAESQPVSFATFNNPGPSTSRPCLEQNENSNSEDSLF